jgi:hypothetical protein
MAINIVRGCYGLAFAGSCYLGIRDGIVAPNLSNQDNRDEELQTWGNQKAREMGVNKNLILIKDTNFIPFGNNLFSIRAGMLVNKKCCLPLKRALVIHDICHIKANDILTWTFVPLIISIFTTVLLNSKFSIAACLAGLATGAISHAGLRQWREKEACLKAMKHSSEEENRAFLKELEEEVEEMKKADVTVKERCVYFFRTILCNPNELIRIYRAHLNITTPLVKN